ncbi:hypothetical protein M3638_03045 [Oceanobacillus profundus]|uniref:hypothetical protein n=1 Tax=Oceanobacillus profundus TaxID=372463 RepID=UPI00203E1653|nr:hypothetical protein [Oceanobacillus profundus]MCM3396816.1 hypothetical protein [Oceanobacillus profundus]
MSNEVWIVIDYEDSGGAEGIQGVFDSEEKAKLFLADYVLKNACTSDYLQLVKKKVEVNK